jgi:dienelactone hydrolase
MPKRTLLVLFFTIWMPLSFFSMATTMASDSQQVNLVTQDQVKIVGWYQLPAIKPSKLPLVIFIHQGGSSKKEWITHPIWQILLKQGYALLAFDLRQHGDSAIEKDDMMDLFNNPKRAPLDLLAVLRFVRKDPRIDNSRIGILGASVGANLAVMAASEGQYQVKSVIAMSGKVAAAQNLSGVKAALQPKNAFLIASEFEQGGLRKEWAQHWFDITQGHRKVSIAPGQAHGSSILTETPALNLQILEWVKKTL